MKKNMDDVIEAKFGQNSALFSLIYYGFQYGYEVVPFVNTSFVCVY